MPQGRGSIAYEPHSTALPHLFLAARVDVTDQTLIYPHFVRDVEAEWNKQYSIAIVKDAVKPCGPTSFQLGLSAATQA